jgi:molybdopterin-guanine dinucleotide biosynthesis protein A
VSTVVAGVSALLLAGGRSRRMGANKALLSIRGRPIIEEEARVLASTFGEILLSTNAPEDYAFLGLRAVADRFPGCGPLAGIHAGLLGASNPRVLAVACDMPFLSAAVLRFLATVSPQADVVVPRIGGEPEPLLAVYSRTCVRPIEESLSRGEFKITRFYESVRVHEVPEEELRAVDPAARSFVNVNTPEELEAARRIARRRPVKHRRLRHD